MREEGETATVNKNPIHQVSLQPRTWTRRRTPSNTQPSNQNLMDKRTWLQAHAFTLPAHGQSGIHCPSGPDLPFYGRPLKGILHSIALLLSNDGLKDEKKSEKVLGRLTALVQYLPSSPQKRTST